MIFGHSERRQFYGETDSSVNKKAKATIASGMTAIVCVGEMLADRESGNAENVVKGQLESSLDGLTVADMERIIIAYEPVWAIGTGKTDHGYLPSCGQVFVLDKFSISSWDLM